MYTDVFIKINFKNSAFLTLIIFSTPEEAIKLFCLLYLTWFTMDLCPRSTTCAGPHSAKKQPMKKPNRTPNQLTVIFRYSPHVQIKIIRAAQDVLVICTGKRTSFHGARIVVMRVIKLTYGTFTLGSVQNWRQPPA